MVAKNTLHMPIMFNNMIPPLIIMEYNLIVNETPNICAKIPTKEHQSIYDATLDIHISLSFPGIFSYFKTRSLTGYEIENYHKYDVTHLSPNSAS